MAPWTRWCPQHGHHDSHDGGPPQRNRGCRVKVRAEWLHSSLAEYEETLNKARGMLTAGLLNPAKS